MPHTPNIVDSKVPSTVPPGLVGERTVATVSLDGNSCQALLDSGSQVTCVSHSFYSSYLSHRKMWPLSDLGVTGAGGHDVPYLGYIEVSVTPAETEAGTGKTVRTLALVMPDNDANGATPFLIGTNTSLLQTMLRRQLPLPQHLLGYHRLLTRRNCT